MSNPLSDPPEKLQEAGLISNSVTSVIFADARAQEKYAGRRSSRSLASRPSPIIYQGRHINMRSYPSLHALGLLTAITASLSGCSFNGSYPDATEADAAKLRFVSNVENSTLDLFDAEHCGGRNTGLLNNLFAADTRRRADMSVAPPADARGYLEIRLKPESEVFYRINTVGSGSVCGIAFNFAPQRNTEYEVFFNRRGSVCTASLNRLENVKGKAIRSPIPLVEKGLPACAGSNPIFPKAAVALPSTPERDALIEQIINASIVADMRPDPDAITREVTAEKVDKVVDDRKRLMGITLPDTYWAEYRQNVKLFATEVTGVKERALTLYKNVYRSQLQSLDTVQIKQLVPDSDTANLTWALAQNNAMMDYYHSANLIALKEAVSNNLVRMADLDRRFNVCKQYSGCWKN
ncbi:hypothetical protein ACTACU_06210 [Pseudomonas syringae]|uniref:hypothetical protein n=1 Tax=Pseudomonas syringae TaxID=317 RepID=UPI003F861551